MTRVFAMAALLLLAACAFRRPITPGMDTEDGRACISGCEAEYQTCTGANVGGGSGPGWPRLEWEVLETTLEHVDDPPSCPQRLGIC